MSHVLQSTNNSAAFALPPQNLLPQGSRHVIQPNESMVKLWSTFGQTMVKPGTWCCEADELCHGPALCKALQGAVGGWLEVP
jgi:hypothetical protein